MQDALKELETAANSGKLNTKRESLSIDYGGSKSIARDFINVADRIAANLGLGCEATCSFGLFKARAFAKISGPAWKVDVFEKSFDKTMNELHGNRYRTYTV